MIVKLKRRSARYPDLSAGQQYLVIGIEADDLRLLNDQGRPFLYPSNLFAVVDKHRPAEWIEQRGDDGELYAYPPQFSRPGFFEDYFDSKLCAVRTFWRVMNEKLANAFA